MLTIAKAALALAGALGCIPCVAGNWVAFVAPDSPQSQRLFLELQRASGEDLRARGLALRFEVMPDDSRATEDEIVERIVAGAPVVILAASSTIALAAKRRAKGIPILFASASDPVKLGLVDSLPHPGGNLTGFTYDLPVEGKQLELLREIAPRARRVGILEDGFWLAERVTPARLAAYEKQMGATLRVFRVETIEAMEEVVLGAAGRDIEAWLVPISNTAGNGAQRLVSAMRKAGKPALYGRTFFVEAGGLASYQEMIRDPMGLWGTMLHKVLSGVPPSRIPVQRPKEFELAVNTAEASRLGIELPASLIKRANRIFSGAPGATAPTR